MPQGKNKQSGKINFTINYNPIPNWKKPQPLYEIPFAYQSTWQRRCKASKKYHWQHLTRFPIATHCEDKVMCNCAQRNSIDLGNM